MRHSRFPLSGLKAVLLTSCFLTACQIADAQRNFVSFSKTTLDNTLRGGSGVDSADVDGDGLPDIIAFAGEPAAFVWYRNPGWEKYTVASGIQRPISAASHDIDGDGDNDLVLASEFDLARSTEGGLVQWFENPGNPQQDQEWTAHFIDRVPASHRVKWGDINGDGRMELVNLPIVGIGATAPRYDVSLSMTAYPIPRDPVLGPWTKIVLDRSLEMAHGITLVNWDEDSRTDILTASFQGVHLFRLAVEGVMVAREQLGAGHSGERPAAGSSEVDMGKLSSGERFIATIEPWHGNEVVVYTPGADRDAPWNRQIIDSGFVGGHGLKVADLDNDGTDEIVAGFRGAPYGLYIFRHDDSENIWRRITLDAGGIALTGMAIEDLNGDSFQDIIGVGSDTRNVVYYQNRGR